MDLLFLLPLTRLTTTKIKKMNKLKPYFFHWRCPFSDSIRFLSSFIAALASSLFMSTWLVFVSLCSSFGEILATSPSFLISFNSWSPYAFYSLSAAGCSSFLLSSSFLVSAANLADSFKNIYLALNPLYIAKKSNKTVKII